MNIDFPGENVKITNTDTWVPTPENLHVISMGSGLGTEPSKGSPRILMSSQDGNPLD
jgi:hypothetical protein